LYVSVAQKLPEIWIETSKKYFLAKTGFRKNWRVSLLTLNKTEDPSVPAAGKGYFNGNTLWQIFMQISINLYQICVFCLFTRVYLQYYCICLQQYWRLVLQFIFNNFVIWCKIFAIKNLFSLQLQKNCNHPPHQSLTSNDNFPSSLAMGLEPTTSGLPAQCLICSSTRSLIEIHENLPILTHIRLL